MKIVFLLLTILMHLVHSQSVQFTPNSPETFVNMILSESKLLLGTSGALYRTDLALNMEQRRQLSSTNRLLVADRPTGTLSGSVMTCDDQICYLLETNNLDNVKWQVHRDEVLLMGGGVARGSFSIGPNGTSDITYGEPAGSVTGRRFVKAALRNVLSNPQEFVPYVTLSESNTNERSDFVRETFVFLNYTYFILQPNREEMRLVRFCQRDQGFTIGGTRSFSSRFEIELRCRTDPNRHIQASNATFKQTSRGPMIFLTINTFTSPGVVRREVCSFSLDGINQLMTQKITECVAGTGMAGFSPKTSCPNHFSEDLQQKIINVSLRNKTYCFSSIVMCLSVIQSQ